MTIQSTEDKNVEPISAEQLADEIVQEAEAQVEEQHEHEHEVVSIEQEKVNELELSLVAAQSTIADQKDLVIRAKAEVDNIRRRSAQEVEKARKFALEKFSAELLPVVDNLERAISSIDEKDHHQDALVKGVELTLQSMQTALEKFGIKVLDPQDKPFNPELHQAMSMQEVEGIAPNTVMGVMQKGYELNGRLIRPAMVMVSKAAPAVDTNT